MNPEDSARILKGRRLEVAIAGFFRASGYVVEQNVFMEGRSGGQHEIDVLARRADGITDIAVAVECKAWNQPIEKAVVSKLSYVLTDCGLQKGVVVSLSGWRSGAAQAARELGIDLWGPDDIARRLGEVSLAQIDSPAQAPTVLGFAHADVEEDLQSALMSQTRGFLGFGREELTWHALAWVPFHLLEVRASRTVKEFLRRPAVKATSVFNLYSALDDTFFRSLEAAPEIGEIEASRLVTPRTKPRTVMATLQKAVRQYGEVVSDAARARHRSRLEQLGVPLPVESVSVDSVRLAYYPFTVGLMRRGDHERLVAIDACRGTVSEAASAMLTHSLTYVLQAIRA